MKGVRTQNKGMSRDETKTEYKTDPVMDQIFPNIPHIERNDHTSDIINQTKEGVKKCVRIK